MYCSVGISPFFFTLEMKEIQRSKGVFVSYTILYKITINH